MVTLQFDNAEKYSVCFTALAMAQHQLQPATWDLHVACLRALRSIGRPTVKTPSGVQLYDLDLLAGTTYREIQLENVEFEHLLDCIQRPMWNGGVIERVVETRDWLKASREPGRVERKLTLATAEAQS